MINKIQKTKLTKTRKQMKQAKVINKPKQIQAEQINKQNNDQKTNENI